MTNTGENFDKREPSYTLGDNENWYRHYGKQYGGIPKNLKRELLYDPTISLPRKIQGKPYFEKIHAPHAQCSTNYNSQDTEAT